MPSQVASSRYKIFLNCYGMITKVIYLPLVLWFSYPQNFSCPPTVSSKMLYPSPAHQLKGWRILPKLCVGDLLRIGFSPLGLPPVNRPSASLFPPFSSDQVGGGILTLSSVYRVTLLGFSSARSLSRKGDLFFGKFDSTFPHALLGTFLSPVQLSQGVVSPPGDSIVSPAFGKIQISSASIFGTSPTLVLYSVGE